MQDETWTTRDGRKMLVGEMDEQHVRNALRMVLRRRRLVSERLKAAPHMVKFLARMLRPHLKAMDERELAARRAEEEKFFEDLENDVFEDRKWGSD